MLSQTLLQSHNSFSSHGYLQNPTSPQPHLSSSMEQQNYDNGSMEAGRKRRESELEAVNDSGDNKRVRRRISRACDQCNQLRTKCDGKSPCAHCSEMGLQCEYARVYKKRGRAPKKDQDSVVEDDFVHNISRQNTTDNQAPQVLARRYSQVSYLGGPGIPENVPTNTTSPNGRLQLTQHEPYYNGYAGNGNMAVNPASHIPSGMVTGLAQQHFHVLSPASFPSDGPDALSDQPSMQQGFGFPLGDDYSVAFMGKAPMVDCPDWMALTGPMFTTEMPMITAQPRPPDTPRFPVLRPLLAHIETIMPQNQACDLLEQYFASSTSTYLRSSNPYIQGWIFRKQSVLHPTEPRPCTLALLASMLWIAAQTSDAAFLSSQLDARGKICQKLLQLTISMLKPLIHNSSDIITGDEGYNSGTQSDVGLEGLVVPADHRGRNNLDRVQIDNIATYMHLATVVSASERKAASLRWWNAAWSLAREMRLGRELPETPPIDEGKPSSTKENHQSSCNEVRNPPYSDSSAAAALHRRTITEEEREERRRTWWLLYMQDRHLAICYNRPMFFLNKECENLLQPLDEDIWQSAGFEQEASKARRRGLNIECTSHSVFGFFLPLMVLLGEILDLNHARNRPRFGPRANRPHNWDESTEDITQQLEAFEHSLREFEASHEQGRSQSYSDAITPPVATANGGENHVNSGEVSLQTKTVVAYGTHIVHVLHILLTGKWDPIAMLDDNDLWISSQSFVTATGHAVSAAKAVGEVIEYDPDLSFMPYFFGIYLLQGSFLLLLFADKLQGDVSADVVQACETIVRAHEACVATLDTQYQRNFRKVMRSALQQVRWRIRQDDTEQQNWRREILKLYRWTGDGTGLAL